MVGGHLPANSLHAMPGGHPVRWMAGMIAARCVHPACPVRFADGPARDCGGHDPEQPDWRLAWELATPPGGRQGRRVRARMPSRLAAAPVASAVNVDASRIAL
jgi:hypothetical protein